MNIERRETGEQKESKFVQQEKSQNETPTATKPGFLRSFLGKIRRMFGEVIDNSTVIKNKSELLKKYEEELTDAEKEAIREGVDFSRCQMDEVIRDYQNGRKVEFECYSPYIADYNMSTGEVWEDKLTNTDEIGIAVGKMLRKKFERARMISLYDEYNTDLPDAADEFGRPIRTIQKKDVPQLQLRQEVKDNFRKNIENLLRKQGIIRDKDQNEKDYLFVSETEKVKDAEELVRQLEKKSFIRKEGEAIYFTNPGAEDFRYREIALRTKNGRWLCEALDSSSFIKPENLEITHLVILPNHFKEQQNKVWEILRVFGIEPTHYHNIFFDEKASPVKVAQIIKEEIERYQKN